MKIINLAEIQIELQDAGDTQITIKNDGYFLQWKTIQIETDSANDIKLAICAIKTLEKLGCEDF